MKKINCLLCTIILLSLSSASVLADVTASTPTNLIQKIASATSYTSTSQSSAQNVNVIQNTTSKVIDGKKSAVWLAALNRIHVQKSIIEWCLK